MLRSPFAGWLLLALTCAGVVPLRALSPTVSADLRKDLRHRFEGKLLLLSVPSSFDVVQFDTRGSPTRAPTGEPWTTAGLVKADKVDVHADQMIIEGHRMIVALSPEKSVTKPMPIATDRAVHVTIDLPSSANTAAEVSECVARVLSFDVAQKLANAWHADVDLSKAFDAHALPLDGKIGTLSGDRAVYAWESGVVSKPKALYKPGPSYSPKALLKRVAGAIRVRVVVNEKGFPEILQIIEHQHEALDANALSALSQWRFDPGLRNGVAAATVVVVELKFHLVTRKS